MSAAIELRTTSPVFAASSAAMRLPPLAALFLWAERRLRRFQRAHLAEVSDAPAKGSAFARGAQPAKSGPLVAVRRFSPCSSTHATQERKLPGDWRRQSSGDQHVEIERRRASSAADRPYDAVRSQVVRAKSGTGRAVFCQEGTVRDFRCLTRCVSDKTAAPG
jgi:hypothetical protein